MEKADIARQDIVGLLEINFGEQLARAFKSAQTDSTLPIFVENAMSVLSDLLGKDKAKEELNEILKKNTMKEL